LSETFTHAHTHTHTHTYIYIYIDTSTSCCRRTLACTEIFRCILGSPYSVVYSFNMYEWAGLFGWLQLCLCVSLLLFSHLLHPILYRGKDLRVSPPMLPLPLLFSVLLCAKVFLRGIPCFYREFKPVWVRNCCFCGLAQTFETLYMTLVCTNKQNLTRLRLRHSYKV